MAMRRTVHFHVVFCFAALVACAKERPAADTTAGNTTGAAAAAAASADKIGETGAMKVPESVRYDSELDVFYVSNINGNPSQKDNNGFIARVRADSTGVVAMLVEGGKKGVTLNAPKGLALKGDTLFVADIDALRAFNRKTGAPIRQVSLAAQKATFLNDVAVGGDGAIYITDTGIAFDAKGGMTHPGVNRIFKIVGTTVTEAAKGDSLNSPNGITWDAPKNRFILAPFGGPSLQTWTPGQQNPANLIAGPGQYDGVEVLAGSGYILVSSWADSAVHIVHDDSHMATLVKNVSAPADIGVDTKRNVLAVPRFNDGKVEYFKIP
jgi:sugar lactone lactonase YvrE